MVFGVLDRGNETTPGVTKPSVSLDFGGGGGGGFGGLAPSIGPFAAAAGLETGLLSLEISRGFAPFVDWAEVLVHPKDGAEVPGLGDTGTVSLSVGDHTGAFACQVDQVEHRADGSVRLGLGNGGRVLAQARLAKSFTEMAPGDVISALCGEAGVDVGSISGGETMPRYVVETAVSLLDHVALLAQSAGRLAAFNSDGALELIDDASAGEELVLSAGDALLDWQLSERADSGAARVTAAGASDPLWLRKDIGPMQKEAGTANLPRDVSAPWLRSSGGVQSLADARSRAANRAAGMGRLLLAGFPDVLPGRVVTLAGTEMDGEWRVMSSRTVFDAATGFSHEVQVARADSGAGALGLGGLF